MGSRSSMQTMEIPFGEEPYYNRSEHDRKFMFGDKEIRVVGSVDDPWFVAKDVCEAIGIGLPANSLRYLEEDEKGKSNLHTRGGVQQLSTISEAGLYSLVFRSRKKKALAFSKWVRSEVLPKIRRTGEYNASEKGLVPQNDEQLFALALHKADKVIKDMRAQINIDAPKVHFFDYLTNTGDGGLQNFGEARHLLRIKDEKGKEYGRNNFVKFLIAEGYIYRAKNRELMPYEKWSKKGYFVRKSVSWPDPSDPDGIRRRNGFQTLFTPLGLSYMHKKHVIKD